MPEPEQFDETRDDGGDAMISEPTLAEIKAEVDEIVSELRANVWQLRIDSDDTRFCRWAGQAPDGLKHEDYIGDIPEPFEGATDMRVRAADMLVNEEVMLLTVAALRAQIRIKGIEADDMSRAGGMTIAMQWLLRNYLGVKWVEELIRLANYYSGDCPGLALMGVSWKQETSLRLEKLTADQLMERYMQRIMEIFNQDTPPEEGIDAELLKEQGRNAAADFKAALGDQQNGAEMLAELLLDFFPELRPARARKVVAQLRKNGEAEFPIPYTSKNGPDVTAKRLFEDWYIPINTQDFQTARIWFEPRWLSKTSLHERARSEEWNEEFLNEVLKHETVAAFPDYTRRIDGSIAERDRKWYRGMYQVITAYYMAINDEGIPGRYWVTIHRNVDIPAHGRRLLDYAHGKYPGHVFRREVLSRNLMDSRGIPEVAGPYQGLLKLYADTFGDHAQIAGVPPIITSGRTRMGTLRIKPLAELPVKRDGQIKWMQPPQYPGTVDNMMKELTRQLDEYFGRPTKDANPDLVALHRDFKVMWWLMNVREVLTQIMQLFQQFATDDVLKRITNRDGDQLIKSADEIRGQFDLDLVFDPRDLDMENLQTMGTIVRDLLMAMDRDKTIDPSAIVAALLWRVSPDLAEAALRPVDKAQADEIADETKMYLQIRSGMEPELADDGSINYQVRAGLYQQMQQMNPQIFADMAPDKLAILQSRIQRLGVMAQQYGDNVTIGRQGGKQALTPAASPSPAQGSTAPATGIPGTMPMGMGGMP
jgi:hypothetical protein